MNELHKKQYFQGVNFSVKTNYDIITRIKLIVLPNCLSYIAPFTKQRNINE